MKGQGECLLPLVLGHGDDLALGVQVELALAFAEVDEHERGCIQHPLCAAGGRSNDPAAVALAHFDGGVVDGRDALLADRPPQRLHLRAQDAGGAVATAKATSSTGGSKEPR